MSGKILVVDDEPDQEQLVGQKFRRQIHEPEFKFISTQNRVEARQRL